MDGGCEAPPPHLHVLGDEDLASLLDHWLRLQLLGRELALARVEHLLTGDAGQRQVGRVGLVAQRHLDGLRIDGAGGVPGWREGREEDRKSFTLLVRNALWVKGQSQSIFFYFEHSGAP